MPSDLREAQRELGLFCSVGAHSFVVTKTELEWPGHKKAKWGRTYSVPELLHKLPAMVRTAAIRRRHVLDDGRIVMAGENLIVRPIGPEVGFVQLDDLKPEFLPVSDRPLSWYTPPARTITRRGSPFPMPHGARNSSKNSCVASERP